MQVWRRHFYDGLQAALPSLVLPVAVDFEWARPAGGGRGARGPRAGFGRGAPRYPRPPVGGAFALGLPGRGGGRGRAAPDRRTPAATAASRRPPHARRARRARADARPEAGGSEGGPPVDRRRDGSLPLPLSRSAGAERGA